jgi:threonine synthase
MGFSFLHHLECSRCVRHYSADVPRNLCLDCRAPLLARYDLDALRDAVSPADFGGREPSLWRYHELLPVSASEHVISLGEGMTPLLSLPRYGGRAGMSDLLLKDEGLVPTGSFKARGAAVGVSKAAELGVRRLAMPTNGNAGAAWSVYGARAGLRSTIVMPVDAPEITRRECVVSGADLYLVDGLINDAGAMVGELVSRSDGAVFNASTLAEPYRLEGKKTMGIEIVEQLGWRMPDVILYPTGGGVGIIGIHKALHELRELGWVSGPLPKLVAVQSKGCAPIVDAYQRGARESEAWPDAYTVAFGITVPKPLGDFLILEAIADTGGTAIAVDDTDLLAEQAELASADGTFICPEGAACLVAVRRLRESGWLTGGERTVVLNTGTGLKYPETVTADPPILAKGAHLP